MTKEGNKGLWRLPYKVVTNKRRKEQRINCMKIYEEYIRDINVLASKFLDKLLLS